MVPHDTAIAARFPARTLPPATRPQSDPGTPEAWRAAIVDKLTLHGRQGSGPRARPRLVHGHGAGGARPRDRPLDGLHARDLPRGPQARLLLLARVPDRPPAVRRDGQSRPDRHRARGAGRTRRGPRPPAPARAGRGARQRRPGPPCRVLSREHVVARHRRARLRHPLRPRHLPPGAAGRLAARTARGVAVVRQPVGVRAAGGHLLGRLRRHRGGTDRIGRHRRASRGGPRSR